MIDIVVYLESYEYCPFLGDFVISFFTLLCLYIAQLLGFCRYFTFFSARKKAINIILADLESSKRGLQLWFFLFLDYFLL